jgi:hypothetical protein
VTNFPKIQNLRLELQAAIVAHNYGLAWHGGNSRLDL